MDENTVDRLYKICLAVTAMSGFLDTMIGVTSIYVINGAAIVLMAALFFISRTQHSAKLSVWWLLSGICFTVSYFIGEQTIANRPLHIAGILVPIVLAVLFIGISERHRLRKR